MTGRDTARLSVGSVESRQQWYRSHTQQYVLAAEKPQQTSFLEARAHACTYVQ